jgi:hypothetical protein
MFIFTIFYSDDNLNRVSAEIKAQNEKEAIEKLKKAVPCADYCTTANIKEE